MPISKPFISIVIPTRDRPEFVQHSLQCLASQNFVNFEVIISDNYLNNSCRDVVALYKDDKRFKYYSPDTPLSMCDNWEFAVSKTQGEYVSVISEKYLFRPDALSTLFQVLSEHPAELVSWWPEKLAIQETSASQLKVRYVPFFKPREPRYFDPIEVLKKRFSFQHPPYSRALGPFEPLGKIYSGCFHRDLLKRIKDNFGRIFPHISPDITSMVAALSLAEKCLDLGQPLMLVCTSKDVSNGIQFKVNTNKARDFLKESGVVPDNTEDSKNNFPITGFWIGISSIVAKDYIDVQSKSSNKALQELKIDQTNLMIRAKENLNSVEIWRDEVEKENITRSWDLLFNQLSEEQQTYIEQQLLEKPSIKPSKQEIHFAGGKEVNTYQHSLSARKRAEMNWNENIVFRIKDEFLFYEDLQDAWQYFSDYYQHSARLLNLPYGEVDSKTASPVVEERAS